MESIVSNMLETLDGLKKMRQIAWKYNMKPNVCVTNAQSNFVNKKPLVVMPTRQNV